MSLLDFLRLAPGSHLIDTGVNVGLPYNGSAPDLGWFETSVPEPILVGDYNGDGKVSAADYTFWRDHMGAATLTNRDPNNSGPVGIDDFESWKEHYGESNLGSGSAAGLTAVPEPTSVLLLMLAAAVWFATRGRA